MNKQASLFLNIVLLVAVSILFYLQFSGKPAEIREGMSDTSMSGSNGDTPSVAYITFDSLTANYTYWNERTAELKEQADKLQKELENRLTGFQQEVNTLQNTAGNMTQNQFRAAEEGLARKQQNLQQYQANIQQQLVQLENQMMTSLYDKVEDFLEDYGKKNNLELILTYQRGSGVWYADKGMDITDDVIEGLNSAYDQEQNGTLSPTDTTAVGQ